MRKVSDAVKAIALESAFLRFGFQYQLLNLTQLAKFIQPLVEARVKKEVTPSAIVMSLSRLGKELAPATDTEQKFFKIHHLVVHTELMILTLFKSPENHREINAIYGRVQKQDGLITVTEGMTEITVILEEKYVHLIDRLPKARIKRVERQVSSLTVKFDDSYIDRPGFLYAVLRQVALQGINIIELSSTATEFILYLKKDSVQLAFDTLFRTFSNRDSHMLLPA